MGCGTGCGRVILIILNALFMLVSLVFMAIGVVLKFFANKFTEKLLGMVDDGISQQTKDDFNIPDISEVTELPFVGHIGVAFMAFGGILFFVSFLACCGACYKWRPLLVLFVIVMCILVICQAVVGGLFLAEDSVLHDNIKDNLGTKVKDDFDADGDDVFSFAINIMQYLLGCCGIRDQEDFPGDLPPSCCLKEIIEGDTSDAAILIRQNNCVNNPSLVPDADYNDKGCYQKLQDKVLDNLVLAAIVLAVILLIQVLEIIFALLIVMEESDSKVSPR